MAWSTGGPPRGDGGQRPNQQHRGWQWPDEEGLYRYMLGRNADVADAKLVLLEGEPSGDDDFDADEGAVLIPPPASSTSALPTSDG